MSLNWAQLDQTGAPLPLDNTEEIFIRQSVQVTLSPRFAKPIPGTVFVSSHRVVFVSALPPRAPAHLAGAEAKSTEVDLRTVSVAIERWNAQLVQPWFGANRYEGELAPVPGGGLDAQSDDAKPVLTILFNEGGVEAFYKAWVVARERTNGRLRHRRQQRAMALGQASAPDDEDVDALPVYEEAVNS